MAVTRTMLRAKNWRDRDIAAVIAEVNDELTADNHETMFVTLFAIAIDLSTGAAEFVNGGHNPPLLLRAAMAPGEERLSWLRKSAGLPLGIMAQFSFQAGQTQLQAGDVLLLYTDGVTEAERADRAHYGEERLWKCLEKLSAATAKAICEDVTADVAAFAAGAPPSDDLALLCVRYHGGGASDMSMAS